jgi:hypothetical protein
MKARRNLEVVISDAGLPKFTSVRLALLLARPGEAVIYQDDGCVKIAELLVTITEQTVTIRGYDEQGKVERAELRIEKGFDRLVRGPLGLPIRPDGEKSRRLRSSDRKFI